MDSLGGLSEFFYNIIPGTLLLLGLHYLGSVDLGKIPGNDALKIFFIIAIGFFLGFLGQVIINFVKKHVKLHALMFYFIKKENEHNGLFLLAQNKLKKTMHANEELSITELFYSMDNYLRNNKQAYVINHFAGEAAFWGNILLGSLILFFRAFQVENYYFMIFLLFTLFFSIWGFFSYMHNRYDSVLKTYLQMEIN